MADIPPTPPPTREPPPRVGGTGMNTRLGPLPYWAWGLIVVAGVVVGWTWLRSRNAQPAATPDITPTGGNDQGLSTEQYESLLALLRDIQGTPSTPIYTPGDPGTPVPVPIPTAPRQAFTINVGAGQQVESFVAAVDARAGTHVPWAALEFANPTLAANVNWGPSGSKDFNARTFKNNATYTVPATWTQT